MVKQTSIAKLAELVGGELCGDGAIEISGFGPLDGASAGQLSFLARTGERDKLSASRAAAFIVPQNFGESEKAVIKVKDPYLAVALIQNYLLDTPYESKGIHETAVIGSDCNLAEDCSIAALVSIGNRVTISSRVEIAPGVVIGDEVVIGEDSVIKAHVTVEQGSVIGCRVIIHPGTVIGSDGYGYATDAMGNHIKRPQLGTVRIDDDVEIGANCCIDRATFGVTHIKSGAKIDNLVQIAHNVVVGENVLLVSQVGLSGSTILGRNVVFGGKASSAGHLTVGDRTMVAGKASVHGDQKPDLKLAGTPAIPAKQWFKAVSLFGRLPELFKEIKRLKKQVAMLVEKPSGTTQGEE